MRDEIGEIKPKIRRNSYKKREKSKILKTFSLKNSKNQIFFKSEKKAGKIHT